MPNKDQIIKIKCPYCGWIRSINIKVVEDESVGDAVQGLSDAMQGAVERIQAALSSRKKDPASYWIDMPECPNCGNVYQYNVRTRETKK